MSTRSSRKRDALPDNDDGDNIISIGGGRKLTRRQLQALDNEEDENDGPDDNVKANTENQNEKETQAITMIDNDECNDVICGTGASAGNILKKKKPTIKKISSSTGVSTRPWS